MILLTGTDRIGQGKILALDLKTVQLKPKLSGVDPLHAHQNVLLPLLLGLTVYPEAQFFMPSP